MTRITGALALVLVALGVVAYVATGFVSLTALIPAAVGLVLLACWAVARDERRHRLGTHAALVVAVLGAAGTLMNVAELPDLFAGAAERPSAVVVSTIMFLLLVGYVVLGVRSFAAARHARQRTAA